MVNSQNGWAASNDRRAIGVDPNFSIRGATFPGGVKSGAASVILGYVAEQFNNRVEKLVSGWCWGWSYREIRGSTETSNHASGTAIDCNAPTHPLGVKNTFSRDQVNTIHTILREVGGVVRWGGDYSGRVDEMHFEINASQSAIEKVANALVRPPAPIPTKRWSTDVIYIQCETEGPGKGVSIAILDAPFFVNLVGNEYTSAKGNIDKGLVPSQWVNVETWRDFDRRSHMLFDTPKPVTVVEDKEE